MHTLARVSHKTNRFAHLAFKAETFEGERILGLFTNTMMSGKPTTVTLSQDDDIVFQFKFVDPDSRVDYGR